MGRRVFPFFDAAGHDATGSAGERAAMLRLLLSEIVADDTDRAVVIRFDGLRGSLPGPRDQAVATVVTAVAKEVEARLSGLGQVVGFDEASCLVVSAKSAGRTAAEIAGEVAKGAVSRLVGQGRETTLFEVFHVIAVSEAGLACEEIAAKPAGPAPAPASRVREAPTKTLVLGDADLHYIPLWHVRRNSVFAYQCKALWAGADGRLADEVELAALLGSEGMARALDLETLHKAVDEIDVGIDRGTLASLLVPVHYDMLARPEDGERYLASLKSLYQTEQERLYLEIVRLPDPPSGDTLGTVIDLIRPYCKGLLLRTGWDVQAFDSLRPMSKLAVGVDVSHDIRGEEELFSAMEEFIKRVPSQAFATYILGLNTVSASLGAVCTGFDIVGSEAIGAAFEDWEMDDYLVKPIDLYTRVFSISREKPS